MKESILKFIKDLTQREIDGGVKSPQDFDLKYMLEEIRREFPLAESSLWPSDREIREVYIDTFQDNDLH